LSSEPKNTVPSPLTAADEPWVRKVHFGVPLASTA
jgi:hypothetical protein